MLYKIQNWLGTAYHSVDRLDLSRETWLIISIGVLGAGMIFLRGFGSRTNY